MTLVLLTLTYQHVKKPPVSELQIRLQLSEVIGTWVAALSVVIGGLFGVYQYLEHKDLVRVERSMVFIDRYHGNDQLLDSRLKIVATLNNNLGQINKVLKDVKVEPSKLGSLYHAEILKIVKSSSLAVPLQHLFAFYEQTLLCREMALCDDVTMARFFDKDGRSFTRTFYPFICNIREEWNNPEAFNTVIDFYVGAGKRVCSIQ